MLYHLQKSASAEASSPAAADHLPGPSAVLTCPVCCGKEGFDTEELLSRHVEECLSRQAISDMLKEDKQQQQQQGRRKDAGPSGGGRQAAGAAKGGKRKRGGSG